MVFQFKYTDRKKPLSQLEGNQARGILPYLKKGQALLFYSNLIDEAHLYLGRLTCFTQSTDSNASVIKRNLIYTPRIMFDQISGHPMTVKLSGKINRQSDAALNLLHFKWGRGEEIAQETKTLY